MDPGCVKCSCCLGACGILERLLHFQIHTRRVLNSVHPEVSRGTDSGVVVCAPICVVCRGSPLCAVAGLAGFSSTSTKEVCSLPPRTHRRLCP